MLLRACGVDLSMELSAYDVSGDAELEHNLRLTAAERLDQAEAELRRLARSPEQAARLGFDASELKWFRPVELFAILDKSQLEYITIGAFGALLHGSGVLSDNIDIVPSLRPANLERLRQAYIALNARTPKNKQLRLDPGETAEGAHAHADAIGPAQHHPHPSRHQRLRRPAPQGRPRAARLRGAHDARLARRHHPHHRRPRRQERRSAPTATPPPARPRADDRARTRRSSR